MKRFYLIAANFLLAAASALMTSIDASAATDFDETRITASFGVVSDVHIDGARNTPSKKFRSALEQLRDRAATQDPNGLDGVLVVGDLINNPYSSASNYVQMYYFKNVYESVFKPTDVPMFYTPGNHDVYKEWTVNDIAEAKNLSSWLGEDYFKIDLDNEAREKMECRHAVIAGTHILAIFPIGRNPVVYTNEAKAWLDNELSKITAEDPESYVLVLTHPMITNTVYGSLLGDYWATEDLTPILSKYPQAMTFGGHLHFPLNDPRSIWQGAFTALGCASVRYMAIENGKYENMRSATVMKDADEFSQGLLLQKDADGNIRITRMDFFNHRTIGEPWTLPAPKADLSHLKAYSSADRSARNSAPTLEGSFSVWKGVMSPDGLPVNVGFPAGKDDEFVHHYVLTLTCADTLVARKNILADFYRVSKPSEMKTWWSQSFGKLKAGEYTLSLTAYDSWGAESNTITEPLSIPKAALKVNVPLQHNWLYFGNGPVKLDVEYSGEKGASALIAVALIKDTTLMAGVKDTASFVSRKFVSKGGDGKTQFNFGRLAPGFYQAFVSIDGIDDIRFNIGVNPESIVSEPDARPDFDEFWASTLAELATVPLDAEFFLDKDHSNELRSTYKVTFKSLGGETIGGTLCIPNKPGKFVTYIDYMGYGAQPYFYDPSAAPETIEFLLSVRDQGIFKRKGHYGWIERGLGSKEDFYYRGAFCDVVRAIDFVCSLSKVDQSRLFSRGESQGGAFTLVSVSLDHRIKACAPSVPFLSDFPDYSKIVGWPWGGIFAAAERQGISRDSLFEMLSYFDIKNLAGRIQCPVHMGFGLQDETCPPHTNFSGYNQIKSEKSWYVCPQTGHDTWANKDWLASRDAFFAKILSR